MDYLYGCINMAGVTPNTFEALGSMMGKMVLEAHLKLKFKIYLQICIYFKDNSSILEFFKWFLFQYVSS